MCSQPGSLSDLLVRSEAVLAQRKRQKSAKKHTPKTYGMISLHRTIVKPFVPNGAPFVPGGRQRIGEAQASHSLELTNAHIGTSRKAVSTGGLSLTSTYDSSGKLHKTNLQYRQKKSLAEMKMIL